MALFDAGDFYNRLVVNFPKRWAGSAAFTPPSGENTQDAGFLYSLLYSVASAGLAFLMTLFAYVRLQTRLATTTDQYADLASIDFFKGRLPRNRGEQDPSFTTRIREAIVAPTGTMAAVKAAVLAYFNANPEPQYVFIDVFDLQSDPIRAAYYGLTDAQFAIVAYYEPDNSSSWFLGQSFLDQNTFLAVTGAFTKSETPPYPALGVAVGNVKDWCYRPIYIVSAGDPVYQI